MEIGGSCWQVIYITPSHMTAKQHMENLENGGEFLGHAFSLWHPSPREGQVSRDKACSIHARNCVIQDNILASVHSPQVR
jgi:hypothetical protein